MSDEAFPDPATPPVGAALFRPVALRPAGGRAARRGRDGGNEVATAPSTLAGAVRTARPKQWLKNLLVFAAPGAAGVLSHRGAFLHALGAFGVLCVVASGVYFLNDAADFEADRTQRRTRSRPVAAGVLSVRSAWCIGAVLVLCGLGLALLVADKFLLVVAIYVAIQLAYAAWLKREAVLDMAAVASGFVLRAIAGAVAVGVPISEWFLIVATFSSLFMVSGKRLADLRSAASGPTTGPPIGTKTGRPTYSDAFLRSVLVMSVSATLTAYCLWAFENAKAVVPHDGHAALFFQLSIVPFTLALLRYGLLVDQGQGGAPEDVVTGDRMLLLLGAAWLIIFALGVYA